MSPYKDDKKDPMADIHSVKIEQPVADSTIASGATDEHDIESPMSVSTDGPLSIEDSKFFTPTLNAYPPQVRARPVAEPTLLANRLALVHLKGGGNELASSSIIRQVGAVKTPSNQALGSLHHPRPSNMEGRGNSQAAPVEVNEVSGSSPRSPAFFATVETDWLGKTLTKTSLMPVALSRQDDRERDPQGEGSHGDQEPIDATELVGPAEPSSTEDAGTETFLGDGIQDQQEEESPENKEDYPVVPTPSPASRTTRSFEEFFKIQPSGLGGLGAFAARELRRHQTILVERPLLRTTHFRLMPDYHKLSEAAKKAFLCLHGSDDGDPFSRVERIKQLNSFAVPGGIAIFEIASRFNHACPPARNVQYVFDNEREVLSLTVCQDVVPAGAELFISYGGSTVDLYSTYGFRCSCGGCTPLTDEDIEKMKDMEYGVGWGW